MPIAFSIAFVPGHMLATDPDQQYVLGPRTARLERALRRRTGAADVIACASGTAGLTLALSAAGVGPGDETIVPALAFPAVAGSVAWLGAVPVFADVDPRTGALDPAAAERHVTARTKALLPAHTPSSMADMPRFVELAARRGVAVVEDAAVAQGSVLRGVPAGRWGDLGVFSFFPAKPFGTPGEGGAVLTDDPGLGRRCRQLRGHRAGPGPGGPALVGHDSGFDEVLAAVQLYRLPTLDRRLERRALIAGYYTDRFAPLAGPRLRTPPAGRDGRCYYGYQLLTDRAARLGRHLADRGIGCRVRQPVPLPRHPAYAGFAPAGARWPHAERVARRSVVLPLWPELRDEQVERVADAVCGFFRAAGRGRRGGAGGRAVAPVRAGSAG